MRRTLESPATAYSWRQVRHAQVRRKPLRWICDRCERDEMTQLDPAQLGEEDRELLEMTAENLEEVEP